MLIAPHEPSSRLLRLCKVCANFSHAHTEGALGFQGLSLEKANPLGAPDGPESFFQLGRWKRSN